MSDLYMLQSKLKMKPHRGCTYIQDTNLSITLQKNHFKILTFWHIIDGNFTKMSQTRTARNNTHLQVILPHPNQRPLRS